MLSKIPLDVNEPGYVHRQHIHVPLVMNETERIKRKKTQGL